MGPSGVEPLTPSLSGTCSNQLSYGPDIQRSVVSAADIADPPRFVPAYRQTGRKFSVVRHQMAEDKNQNSEFSDFCLLLSVN